MSYYAVKKGYKPGIYNTWEECKKNVNGFKRAEFKKFKNIDNAKNFINITEENKIEDYDIIIYTDGGCINNGKKNAKASIGVYFGKNDNRNISSRINGKQTNNTAEIKAIIKAIKIVKLELKKNKKVLIYSDSRYAIRCCKDYGEKMNKIDWKKDIPNKNLVKKVYLLCKKFKNLNFKYIKAHTNNDDIHSKGNDMADKLASKALED